MNITKCPYGHFYDRDKFDTCPGCAQENIGNNENLNRDDISNQKTVSKVNFDMEFGNQLTERYLESVHDKDKTISLSFIKNKSRPVCGWLICISGSQKGRSLDIFSGRNFAGRSKNMDIILTDDNEISRDKHFFVVFDPKSIEFSVVAGSGETQLNGETINGAKTLHENDEILVGKTKYLFVPYCNEERNWNEKN